MKKILVIGGTGAMGIYLVPELLTMGYKVDVISFDSIVSINPKLRYIKMDAMDDLLLGDILKNEYNAIIDFMVYENPSATFAPRMALLLENTEHYISLSSYRVYADRELPTKETSPRLLDVTDDKEYLDAKEYEYSLHKAVCEDMLRLSDYKNWTIVRPAITYSKFRFQLVTLEAPVLIYRMKNRKKVLLPVDAMKINATMSWAGDVAKMIARLVLNKNAYRETYTVSTAEHHTWGEIAKYYKEIGRLSYKTVDTDTYLRARGPNDNSVFWQLKYDRMVNRIMDNTKILNATGLKQSELMPLKEGLMREYNSLPQYYVWQQTDINDRMDRYFG